MNERLAHKVVLVTGVSSGIGAATAARLDDEGARVIGADKDIEGGRTVVASLSDRCIFRDLDVADERAWSDLGRWMTAEQLELDGIANIAGIAARYDDLESCSQEDWRAVLDVNLDGVFLGSRFGVQRMRGRGGSIVNIASIIGLIGDGNMMAYGASKGGVRLMSRSIAAFCASERLGIRCNSVHPGYIVTPMVTTHLDFDVEPEQARLDLVRKHPMGRLGEASEVAALVAYLLSDDAKFVNGSELTVDGGYVAA